MRFWTLRHTAQEGIFQVFMRPIRRTESDITVVPAEEYQKLQAERDQLVAENRRLADKVLSFRQSMSINGQRKQEEINELRAELDAAASDRLAQALYYDGLEQELEAYKRAKAENDERFMLERDAALYKLNALSLQAESLAEHLHVALQLADKDLLTYEKQREGWRKAITEFKRFKEGLL